MFVCVFVLHGLQDGVTPLHLACQQSDNAAVVGLLLDRGAYLHAKDKVSVIKPLTHAPIICASLVLWPVLHHRCVVWCCTEHWWCCCCVDSVAGMLVFGVGVDAWVG